LARCRFCEKSGLAMRTNKQGVCKPCAAAIQQDVERKLAEVKEALVYIRCSKDPNVQGSFCDAAMETVAKLAAYENRRLAEIRPSPAAMLAMLRSKREEAASSPAEQADVSRPAPSATAYLSATSEPARETTAGVDTAPRGAPELAGDADAKDRVTARRGEQVWWAWEPSASQQAATNGEAHGASGNARGNDRLPVDCLALLDPGAIRGTLQNISPGGLFLQTDTLHPPGRPVRLIISTAHGPAKAQGVVRWVRMDTLSGEASGMGIEFTKVTQELRAFLSARLGCALPAAGPRAHTRAAPTSPTTTADVPG